MNVRDSEVICGLLKKAGYKLIDDPKQADIVILNTCSVRQHAEEKVWSEIGSIVKRGKRDEGRRTVVGVIGCMAQNYKDEIFQRAPAVDFVVGPQDIAKIPEIIKKLTQDTRHKTQVKLFEKKIWETDGEVRPEEIYHTGFHVDKEHAFVVISEGCENFCSYCVVPYVRGKLRHRSYVEIIKEIEGAIGQGITKITLLGQNVNSYRTQDTRHKTQVDFIKLLKLINDIEGLKEFSFITSHPKDTSVELFKAMAECNKLKKRLHLPIQSGSDRILKLMNRNYTRKFYLDLAEVYRRIVKDGVLATDIIVGFPTETEADFQHTYDLVKQVKFSSAYIFKYSSRPHTEASKLPDDVAKEEKERRHRLMLELQKKISKEIGYCILFVICILCIGIFNNAYALGLEKIKVDILKEDYKAAITEGEKILAQVRPDTAGLDELYYILGISYLKDGNYLRASDIFEIILNEFKKSKFHDQAKLGLADTFLLRDNLDQAENNYKELIEKNSKLSQEAYYRLSQIAFKRGDTDQGKEYLSKLNKDFPFDAQSSLEKPAPTQAVSAPVEFYYSVQVGSFGKEENAKNLRDKLNGASYEAYIEETGSDAEKVFRVKAGKLKTLPEAQELAIKLAKEGYPTKICP